MDANPETGISAAPSGRIAPRCASTLLFTRSDVERLLTLDACIAAVEDAFRQHATGDAVPLA